MYCDKKYEEQKMIITIIRMIDNNIYLGLILCTKYRYIPPTIKNSMRSTVKAIRVCICNLQY
jgi:hypothetical protein